MTTGSYTKDGRVLTATSFGNAYVGKYITKTWNGADSASLPHLNQWNTYTTLYSETLYTLAQWQILSGGNLLARTKLDVLTWSSTPTWPPSISTPSDVLLWNKMGNLVRGHSFNAGIAAAESFESFRTLRDGSFRIFNALRFLRKGNLPSVFNALGVPVRGGLAYRDRSGQLRRVRNPKRASLASTWLDLQYGWKPILSDIYEASNAFFASTNKPLVNHFRVSSRNVGSWGLPGGVSKFTTNYCYKRRILHYWQTEKYSPAASLGLTDPLSVAWELVPFSFVADWFYPLGAYLEARSFVRNAIGTYAFCDLSYNHILISNGSFLSGDATALNKRGGRHEKFQIKYTRGAKQTLSGSFLDGSRVPLPAFKPLGKALSVQHLLNGIALARVLTR